MRSFAAAPIRVRGVHPRPVETNMERRKIDAQHKEGDTIPKPVGLGGDALHNGLPVELFSRLCPAFVQVLSSPA